MASTQTSQKERISYLAKAPLDIGRGIEKEGLRCDQNHFISQTDHPASLGSTLTHPEITTDYSEALLELITPVCDSREALLDSLERIHQFVAVNLENETLWSGSMPCRLDGEDSIRIAQYGSSNIGQLKQVYREGLAVRYGKVMQSIAGLHYNFSLSDAFWQGLYELEDRNETLCDYKSQQYFHLIRNFRRYSWMLMYLFGASPATDKSFVAGMDHDLHPTEDGSTYYKPYACSLRMGDLGYHNNAQASLNICFNQLSSFTQNLQAAIRTPYPPYEDIGLERDGKHIQMNTNILQIENEYYSAVRPKRTTQSGERPTDALNARGVEYIEVRCLDLNPYQPLGMSAEQIDFMDVFLVDCLMKPSPIIDEEECGAVLDNFANVVERGREPGLKLLCDSALISVPEWSQLHLESMLETADAMDQHSDDGRYRHSIETQLDKIRKPELLPSARILDEIINRQQSWLDLATRLSVDHQSNLKQAISPETVQSSIEKAETSIKDQHAVEASDTISFEDYLKTYRS